VVGLTRLFASLVALMWYYMGSRTLGCTIFSRACRCGCLWTLPPAFQSRKVSRDSELVAWPGGSRSFGSTRCGPSITQQRFTMPLIVGVKKLSKPKVFLRQADSLNDIDSRVHRWQVIASALPFQDPDRAVVAHNIARYHSCRYLESRQKEDLDQAIV
jgi:hypothetical protein